MPSDLCVICQAPVTAAAKPMPMTAPEVPPAPAKTPTYPNPSYRLDSSLGIVVMEFRSSGGDVRSLPTRQQLDAYVRSLESGPTPDGGTTAHV